MWDTVNNTFWREKIPELWTVNNTLWREKIPELWWKMASPNRSVVRAAENRGLGLTKSMLRVDNLMIQSPIIPLNQAYILPNYSIECHQIRWNTFWRLLFWPWTYQLVNKRSNESANAGSHRTRPNGNSPHNGGEQLRSEYVDNGEWSSNAYLRQHGQYCA